MEKWRKLSQNYFQIFILNKFSEKAVFTDEKDLKMLNPNKNV